MPSRRDFLKKLALGIPAGLLLPSLFTACSEEDLLFDIGSYEGKVAVIGAGIAGLHAASILQKQGVDTAIYEASSRIGGRIKSQALHLPDNEVPPGELLTRAPVELGADLIYGRSNLFYDLARNYTPALEQLPQPTKHFIDDTQVSFDVLRDDAAYVQYLSFLDQVRANQGNTDISLDLYSELLQTAAEEGQDQATIDAIAERYGRMRGILDAHIAAEYGVSPHNLSVEAFLRQERLKTHRQLTRYRLQEDSMYAAVLSAYGDLGQVNFNSEVEAIDYSGEKIALTLKKADEPIYVDKVILTVPVAMLPRITFTPNLPQDKQDALENIKMSGCTKIFVRFREKFWDESFGTLYLSRLSPFRLLVPHPTESILIFYAYGDSDESLKVSTNDTGKIIDRQVNSIFGDSVAARRLEMRIFSWTPGAGGEEEFIPGAYSYTLPGASGARSVLAAPLQNKLYFAGEATHTKGHAATVHGAMETGYKVASEILKST